MEPQRGAFTLIFNNGGAPNALQPLLEVKNIRKLDTGNEIRYAITVTDGEFVVKALAIPGSTLLPQIEANAVVVNTLLRVTDYRLEYNQGNAFMLVMKADVLGVLPEDKRAPMEALRKFPQGNSNAPAAEAAPQAPPQAAPQPPWAAQSSAPPQQPNFTTPERRTGNSFVDQTPPPQSPYGGMNPYGGVSSNGGGSAYGSSSGASGQRNGSITDFFGQQALAGKPPAAQGGFLPIAELSPYTNGRWRVKARVVTKGDIRRFSNARGEGQLFKVDIADKTGEISATFFGKAVDTWYTQLRQGQVYTWSKGHIKQGNPRWDKTEHVLTFDEGAQIEAVEDDSDVPGVTFDFKPLCMVQELPVNTNIDCQAVIVAVQEPMTFTSKNTGKELNKREVNIWDNSGPEKSTVVTVTIWGEKALTETYEIGAPVFIKGARVSEWNGQKDLSSPGVFEQNPDDRRAFALKAQFDEQQRIRPIAIATVRPTQASSAGRKSIQACREEDLNLGPPPSAGQGFDPFGPKSIHRHYVLATVTSLPVDRMPCYPSCPGLVDSTRPAPPGAATTGTVEKRSCNKKVTMEAPGIWRCAAGHVCQQPVFRYLCKMQVMDHSDSIEVNVYDNVARTFFGCEAGEYAKKYEGADQDTEVRQLHGRVLWKRVVLKMRAQKEIWQESERVRYNVDEAHGVVMAKEARTMLEEVRRALASNP